MYDSQRIFVIILEVANVKCQENVQNLPKEKCYVNLYQSGLIGSRFIMCIVDKRQVDASSYDAVGP